MLLAAAGGASAVPRCEARSIVGAWTIIAHVPGQPLPIGALYTFSPDGALLAARTGAGLTAGQQRGKWLGPRRFAATVLYFLQTADGLFNGSLKARQAWMLSPDGRRLETRFRIDIFDAEGNVVGVVEGEATATRQQGVLLPPPGKWAGG